ncbi:hypothetical protein ACWD04_00650 [Streptomyces sp. NPDC002911]
MAPRPAISTSGSSRISTVSGCDLAADPAGVREKCGPVARSGGVDPHATVREDLVTRGPRVALPAVPTGTRALRRAGA